MAAIVAFAVSIVTIFPAFCCGFAAGPMPMGTIVAAGFIFELVAVVSVYAAVAIRNASGKADVVIDKQQRTFALPETGDRKQQLDIPLANFLLAEVLEEEKKDSEGASTIHVPVATWQSASVEPMKARLMELNSEEDAQEVAAMIRSAVAAVSSGY